jgi:transglutaminase-like putative cysteine protease
LCDSVARGLRQTVPREVPSRPLTDDARGRFAKYLQANAHAIIDADIRKLANGLVGAETNPVRAACTINDWVLDHVDYWVKIPKTQVAYACTYADRIVALRDGRRVVDDVSAGQVDARALELIYAKNGDRRR